MDEGAWASQCVVWQMLSCLPLLCQGVDGREKPEDFYYEIVCGLSPIEARPIGGCAWASRLSVRLQVCGPEELVGLTVDEIVPYLGEGNGLPGKKAFMRRAIDKAHREFTHGVVNGCLDQRVHIV